MSGSILGFDAYIIDLDGVVTDTIGLHAQAWKCVLDGLLAARVPAGAEPVPFRQQDDYFRHLHGRPRAEGIRAFLGARGIDLPDGGTGEPVDALTVDAVGRRKSQAFRTLVEQRGVHVHDGARRFLDRLQTLRRPVALVTASRNGRFVLEQAGLAERFRVVVDGEVMERERLTGLPDADGFVFATAWLGVEPAWAVVVDATVAGVAAGRAGGFGCVVGVQRGTTRAALRAAGADIVVEDLADLL